MLYEVKSIKINLIIIQLLISLKKLPMILFMNIILGITILLNYLIRGQNYSRYLLRLNIINN